MARILRSAAARSVTASVLALSVGACSSIDGTGLWSFGGEDDAGAQAGAYADLAGSQAALLRLGDATMDSGDAGTAVQFYRRAALADPSAATPFVKLGAALQRLDAHEDAVLSYRRAVDIDGTDADAHYGLGKALLSLGQHEDAVEALRAAIEIEGSSRVYNALGVALDMSGDRPAAQAVYRSGLADLPDDLTLLNNLGLSLALDGRSDEAIAILLEVADRPEAGARHRQNLALALGLAGRIEEAAAVGRKDLRETEIQGNLAFYEWLRIQPGNALAGTVTTAGPLDQAPVAAAAELPAVPAVPVEDVSGSAD